MTSKVAIRSKLDENTNEQHFEHSFYQEISYNRHLSPIVEGSLETLRETPKSSNHNDQSLLIERVQQLKKNFEQVHDYFFAINKNLKEIKMIFEEIRFDQDLTKLVAPIAERFSPIQNKAEQINRLLDPINFDRTFEKISSIDFQIDSTSIYKTLVNSVEISLNQKATLIDHSENEYRYAKFHLNEFRTQLKEQEEFLSELLKRIELNSPFDQQMMKKIPYEPLDEQEFNSLVEEYERLKIENQNLIENVNQNH